MSSDKYRESIGKFLAEARNKAKITQRNIAEAAGVQSQFISNIERGQAPPPLSILKHYVHLCRIPKKALFQLLVEEKRQILKRELF